MTLNLCLVRTPAEQPVGVAILPFRLIDSDRETTILASGLTEDLTTRLGNWWFPVICPESAWCIIPGRTFHSAVNVLNVGFFVSGSVPRRRGNVRVQARLLRAVDGVQLWASQYHRKYDKLFLLQDELTAGIVANVRMRLLVLAEQRVATCDPQDLAAWEVAVRGCALFRVCTPDANREARTLLREAVWRDRQFPWAYYLLALTYQRSLLNQWERPDSTLASMAEVGSEFERYFPNDSRSNVISAYIMLYRGERRKASDLLQSAIAHDPNNHLAYSLYGGKRWRWQASQQRRWSTLNLRFA